MFDFGAAGYIVMEALEAYLIRFRAGTETIVFMDPWMEGAHR